MTSQDSEANRLGGRMRRYVRVSGAVGGLAARLAGERYLGWSVDREQHARELRAALGGIKGPLMKVAQILSTIPDALPKEYARELTHLQADAPAMGWPFVKRRMAAELGVDWRRRFATFEHTAAKAASLGQVHRATSLDGEPLACKLQYPDMQSAVNADLGQLRMLFQVYERYDKAINTRQIHAEIADRLCEELDYDLEARHMRLYGAMLADEAGIHVPRPLADLSTGRLLTMTWLDGAPLERFVDSHQDLRDAVAVNMFRAWYVPFYEHGVIHGDPHMGNYSVHPDGAVNLLDFGCIRTFPPGFVGGVIDLYHALRHDDEDLAVHAYRTWGFENLTREVIDILNHWARFLYRPLMEDRVQGIAEDVPGDYGREVAEKVHGELRRLGGVTPPREFVFMDRAAIGLGGVFIRLKARVNWHRLFHELIEGFDTETLARRQQTAFTAARVPLPRPIGGAKA